jgi:hypothetical protein
MADRKIERRRARYFKRGDRIMKADEVANRSSMLQGGFADTKLAWSRVVVMALLLIAIYAIGISPPPELSQFTSSVVFP